MSLVCFQTFSIGKNVPSLFVFDPCANRHHLYRWLQHAFQISQHHVCLEIFILHNKTLNTNWRRLKTTISLAKLIVVFSRRQLVFSVLLWRINISKQTWCCDIWKACCNQRYRWCLFAQGSKTNKEGTFFPIENVWKHTKDILCSVWLKALYLG